MTDEELKELVASLAIAQKKTDEQMNKTDAKFAKTEAFIDNLSQKWDKTEGKLDRLSEIYGGASNNHGKVAEEFFYNSLRHKPELGGIHFDFIMKNANRSKGKLQEEYDILLVNGNIVYIIEVKYKLHEKDIENFLERKVPNFRILFPEYKDYEVFIAFASFSVEEDLIPYAKEKGLTLLQRRGDIFETLAA